MHATRDGDFKTSGDGSRPRGGLTLGVGYKAEKGGWKKAAGRRVRPRE